MVRASVPKLSTRERIVSAAAERFHALGYSACGVQEIVDAAGVPKGSGFASGPISTAGKSATVFHRNSASSTLMLFIHSNS